MKSQISLYSCIFIVIVSILGCTKEEETYKTYLEDGKISFNYTYTNDPAINQSVNFSCYKDYTESLINIKEPRKTKKIKFVRYSADFKSYVSIIVYLDSLNKPVNKNIIYRIVPKDSTQNDIFGSKSDLNFSNINLDNSSYNFSGSYKYSDNKGLKIEGDFNVKLYNIVNYW